MLRKIQTAQEIDHRDKFYIRGQLFTRHVMYIIGRREYKAEGDD